MTQATLPLEPADDRFAIMRRASVALGVAFSLSFLVWLGGTGARTRDEVRIASQRTVRVAELLGTITYLDEWLTMSARMAVATGERRWIDRYNEAAPKLDAAVVESAALATPEVRTAFVSTADEAHRDLVTMERRAFALAEEGDLKSARTLLDGPEFAYLEGVYATGVEVFGQELRVIADSQSASLSNRAWLEAGGFGLFAVLLVTAILTLRGRMRLRRAMARTAAVARTDVVTGLPNRSKFYDDLQTMLAGAGRTSGGCALLLIDLDRFKAANDAHGHTAGDALLKRVALRLQGLVRPGDTIARVGGDEFALVLSLGEVDAQSASEEAAQVAVRIIRVLAEPFSLDDGILIQIGASVGTAFAEIGSGEVEALIHQADVALHRAKSDGRGCFRAFEAGMDEHVRARALLEGDLRQAIADDVIVPHFQPLVDIPTGRLIGVEMLARWPHPTRGMVSPAEFIPVAEDLGLIGSMSDKLLRKACETAAHWPDDMTVACNVSPLQLRDPGLPAMIRQVLDETGFPACRLEIEVTESALVGDLGLARALLMQIKSLGVRLALDDFGTGYSSLRHLQSLPFDKLKIDASFVGAMVEDKESWKIVSAVVGLGHSLGLSIVAEGVETEEVAELLRDLGCDIGQGWLFGRPVPGHRIDTLIRDALVADKVSTALVA